MYCQIKCVLNYSIIGFSNEKDIDNILFFNHFDSYCWIDRYLSIDILIIALFTIQVSDLSKKIMLLFRQSMWRVSPFQPADGR